MGQDTELWLTGTVSISETMVDSNPRHRSVDVDSEHFCETDADSRTRHRSVDIDSEEFVKPRLTRQRTVDFESKHFVKPWLFLA